MTAPALPGPGLWTVLTPKWRGALVRIKHERTASRAKFFLLSTIGICFWTAVFGIAFRVLRYIRHVEDIGNLLAAKVLGIILVSFLSILILSNIITALSTFFLAKDLDFLVAAPIDWRRFYLAKLGETVVHSSWMVALLVIPILTAYGIVYSGGPLFPFICVAAFAPFLLIPAVAGTIVTVALVNVFPARRARELLGLIAIGGVGLLVLMLRLIRPERLARPDGFRNFVDYLAVLRTPTSPYLPSEWTASMIMNWLLRVADARPIAMLWATALGALAIGALVHRTTLPLRVLQGAGGCGAADHAQAARPDLGRADMAPAGQAGADPQGPPALLPRQHAVEPADPAGGAADGVPVQHQVSADSLGRAAPLRPRHRHLVPQPRSRRIRAGGRGGAIHLSRDLARGAADVAAPFESARSGGVALEQVLDGDHPAARSGPRHHRPHQPAARGRAHS